MNVTRLLQVWETIRSSLWFLPSICVGLAIFAAIGVVQLDEGLGSAVDEWPLVLGFGADGARGMLTTIASSVITVAGVAFSITIVTLSLTASTYSPRALRNFVSDRGNQAVLGILVGTFVYCLLVLRTIRSGDAAFVPLLATSIALLLALVSLGMFIYFVHHTADAIQVATITAEIATKTRGTLERLFPECVGQAVDDDEDLPLDDGCPVAAQADGYIQFVDTDKLLQLAMEHDLVLVMERGIGEYVADGVVLVSVTTGSELDEEMGAGVRGSFSLGKQRTLRQDVEFGVRQLVDIALKALSPGINDPTTAIQCLDHLASLLHRLATREIPSRYHYDDRGALRLVARGPTFGSVLSLGVNQIASAAQTHVVVLVRLLEVLEDLARIVEGPRRRELLLQQANRISRCADRGLADRADREAVNERLHAVGSRLLDTGSITPVSIQRPTP